MAYGEPSFTLGVEEEYLLVNQETCDLVRETPDGLMEKCSVALKDQVSPEFFQCQIEVGTRVCRTITEVREELVHLRGTIAHVGQGYGLAPIAASTHPFARWVDQHRTHEDRYDTLAKDLGGVIQRMLICGMHVHVCIEDADLRIDIHNQLSYFLPHLLALSTSSPFWQGRDMRLKSYRLVVFDALPRTGLPSRFSSFGEYERMVNVLVRAGLIEDASMIWWDLRPSTRFPTLEMRICDMPTRLNDTVAITALYVCLVRMLYRLRGSNQLWRRYSNALIEENRWRAQRYGMDEGLIDFGLGSVVPYAGLADELIGLVREDAEAMGCVAEIEHIREIVKRGTSADHQRTVYAQAIHDGAQPEDALKAVVRMLMSETAA